MQLVNIVGKNSNNTCSSPNIKKTIIAKGDSAATAHYFRLQDADVLENKTNITGPTIKQPDNTDLTSEGTGTIPLSKHPLIRHLGIVKIEPLKIGKLGHSFE